MIETPFYHKTIRSILVGFGSMFSDIRFERQNEGVTEQEIKVPIAYSNKQKWMQAIEQNPEGAGTSTSLPRLAFELTGYSYDPSRKLNRAQTVRCTDETGIESVLTPVPYNIDLSLYFATNNQEDALQILEQILPYFAPEQTLSLRTVPALNIITDVPYVLNSVSFSDDFEGGLDVRRLVVHTLNFTAKANLYGKVKETSVIKQVEANLTQPELNYVASQNLPTDEIVEQWLEGF